jgi:hypothetical protein
MEDKICDLMKKSKYDKRAVEISANINKIIENLGSLMRFASNIVTSNRD